MKELFNNIGKYLPLKIDFCQIEEYFISFGSKEWSFYSDSSWRIVKDGRILFSDENFNSKKIIEIFKSNEVLSISPLTSDNLDPVLKLSNSYELQLFSKTTNEPWKVSLSDIVFVP